MVTIEPIRNQYLTALKERQHIIDKLNEIIVGLNALDFDDLTTIHTKLTEIETEVNNVKSDLDLQVEQIESELTSHDTRITGNTSKNRDIENHLNSFESDTEVNLNNKVNKSGDTMTGNLGIPTTSTGVRDSNAVNGIRLQNDLDNYAPMLRVTGNQISTGTKEGNWTMYRMDNPNGTSNGKWLRYCEMNTSFSLTLMEFVGQHGNNGYCYAKAIVSGTQTYGRIFPIDNVPCNSQLKIVCGLNRTSGKMEIWIYMHESISVREMAIYINQPDKRNVVYLNEEYDEAPTNDNYAGLNYILGSE